jgi:hypothetical protein
MNARTPSPMHLATAVICVHEAPRAMRFLHETFGIPTRFLDPDVQVPGPYTLDQCDFNGCETVDQWRGAAW